MLMESSMGFRCALSVLISSSIAARAYRRKSVDLSGVAAGIPAMVIHMTAGYRYAGLLLVFFFTSSRLTRFGEEKKKGIDAEFKEGGQRNWIQVLANSAIASILVVIVATMTGGQDRCLDTKDSRAITCLIGGIIGHYCCCNGDTWSSELGLLSKAQPRLITTFKRVHKGTNGGVTIDGLLAAAAGGFVIGVVYILVGLFTVKCVVDVAWRQLLVVPISAAAGLCGSLIDSILGSMLQYSGYCTVRKKVNQLLQVAHKYQTAVNESGSVALPIQDLQASCNMFTSAGCQLARSLELHSLNDLGFSKSFVRCLQISEVVNSMKELIDVNMGNKIRPIESLKSYSRQAQAAAKFQSQKIHDAEQIMTIQSQSADQNSLTRTTGVNTGLGSYAINGLNPNLIVNSVPPSAAALNNYQYLLRTSNQNLNPLQLSSFGGANLPQPGPILTKVPSFNGSVLPSPQQSQPANSFPQRNNNPHASPVDPNLEQHVIQQLLQEMINNSKGTGTPQQIPAAPHANCNVAAEMVGSGLTESGGLPARASAGLVNRNTATTPSRSNSFKSAVNNNSSSSSSSFNEKMDLPPNLHLPELDQDIWQELTEGGMQL